jgi:hypothetical protein
MLQMIEEAERFLTVEEARVALRCSRWKIFDLARENRLELRKFDRKILVTESSLKRLLREIASTPFNEPPQDDKEEDR